MDAYLRNPWVQAIAAGVGAYYALNLIRPAMLVNADGTPKYPTFTIPIMSGMVGAGVLAAYTMNSRRGIGSPVAVVQPAIDVAGAAVNTVTGPARTPIETALLSANEF